MDALYKKYLSPPKLGIEIGASSLNLFPGITKFNIDLATDLIYQSFQKKITGRIEPVHIFGRTEILPFKNNSLDFVLSSNVLEHLPDPISAFLEWDRVLRLDGIIYMNVPHKDRFADLNRKSTTLPHLLFDFIQYYGKHQSSSFKDVHYHAWVTEDIINLFNYLISNNILGWEIIDLEDPDTAQGTGFTVVLKKKSVIERDEMIRSSISIEKTMVKENGDIIVTLSNTNDRDLYCLLYRVQQLTPACLEEPIVIEDFQKKADHYIIKTKGKYISGCFNLYLFSKDLPLIHSRPVKVEITSNISKPKLLSMEIKMVPGSTKIGRIVLHGKNFMPTTKFKIVRHIPYTVGEEGIVYYDLKYINSKKMEWWFYLHDIHVGDILEPSELVYNVFSLVTPAHVEFNSEQFKGLFLKQNILDKTEIIIMLAPVSLFNHNNIAIFILAHNKIKKIFPPHKLWPTLFNKLRPWK